MLIRPDGSFLLVVDVQAKLAPAIDGIDTVVANLRRLVQTAGQLDLPVRVLEENPAGLGRTVEPLAELVPESAVLEKMYFSCAREADCARALDQLDRPQAVIGGSETHVCVLQSALGLQARGFTPFVVEDASASRRRRDHDAAIARLRAAGAGIVTTEMVLFEWLERAGTPEFRETLALIK